MLDSGISPEIADPVRLLTKSPGPEFDLISPTPAQLRRYALGRLILAETLIDKGKSVSK